MMRDKRDVLFAKIIGIYEDVELLIDEMRNLPEGEKVSCFKEAKPLFDVVSGSAELVSKTYVTMLKNGTDHDLFRAVEAKVQGIMLSIAQIAQDVSSRVA